MLDDEKDKFEMKVGNYKVIQSGVIRTAENEISFTIDELSLKYIFSTTEDEKTKYKSIIINDKEMVINLYNFSSKTGQGIVDPISIGTFGDDEEYDLFVTFYVKSGVRSKEFQYSFLIMAK